jgi:sterol desaturase/sphingolipid hydroxylase (fatty acid hydroxylase superfamily)
MLTKAHSMLAPLESAWRETSAADLRAFAVLAAFALLFAWEARRGYRKTPPKTGRQSYLSNLGTFLLNDTLMSLMSVSSLLLLAEKASPKGVLDWIPQPALKSVLSLLLFDLALYLWHRANHTFDCLWMFHKVHHSDPSMNVSTAFRLHFVEVVFTTLVKAAFIMMTGAEAAMLLANEALITVMVMFHHANVRFKGERVLGWLVVVPRLHRVHHSTLRKEHDNNYGAVFSFWDRLFGSFAEGEPVTIGLKSVPGQGVFGLVRYGLTCAWTPAPKMAKASAGSPSPQFLQSMIAEAAYYRAEKRGFAPGNDFVDWLEAEREIRTRLGGKGGPPNSSLAG